MVTLDVGQNWKKSYPNKRQILSFVLFGNVCLMSSAYIPLSCAPQHPNANLCSLQHIHNNRFHPLIPSYRQSTIYSSSDSDHIQEEPSETISYPLEQLLHPSSKCDVDQVSPTTLAYIGDSVYELMVRSRYIWPSRRTTDLQSKVVGIVRAESQSQLLAKMMKSDSITLTSKEESVLKRGRNAGGSGSRKKNKGPKRFFSEDGSANGGATIYQDSTAFEALIGYLYIKDTKRCFEILNWIQTELDNQDTAM